jgi:hypothetical protein
VIGRRVECRLTAVLVLRSEDKQAASQAFDHQLIVRLLRASVGSTNGTSLSVIFYYQMTYDSTLAADLRIIQICATVHLTQNKGISTL